MNFNQKGYNIKIVRETDFVNALINYNCEEVPFVEKKNGYVLLKNK